jgi:hypothetical protein
MMLQELKSLVNAKIVQQDITVQSSDNHRLIQLKLAIEVLFVMVEPTDLNLPIQLQAIFVLLEHIVMRQPVFIIVMQEKLVFSKVPLTFLHVCHVKKVTIALVATMVLLLVLLVISVLRDHQSMIRLPKNLQLDITIQLVKRLLRLVHTVILQRMLVTQLVIVVSKDFIVMLLPWEFNLLLNAHQDIIVLHTIVRHQAEELITS